MADVKNRVVEGIANTRAEKIDSALWDSFPSALNEGREPTPEEQESAVMARALAASPDGELDADIVSNQQWYIENQLLPMLKIVLLGDDYEHGLELMTEQLYVEELPKHISVKSNAKRISQKRKTNWGKSKVAA